MSVNNDTRDLATLLEETARKFGDARRQVAEDAIKQALALGWSQVYVWTTIHGETWTAHAAADLPEFISGVAQDIERFDLRGVPNVYVRCGECGHVGGPPHVCLSPTFEVGAPKAKP